eukprot:342923-Chlamydomonas_euryale.AAC.1
MHSGGSGVHVCVGKGSIGWRRPRRGCGRIGVNEPRIPPSRKRASKRHGTGDDQPTSEGQGMINRHLRVHRWREEATCHVVAHSRAIAVDSVHWVFPAPHAASRPLGGCMRACEDIQTALGGEEQIKKRRRQDKV